MSVFSRNNVQLRGTGDRAMIFAHGFGCNQNMWRFVAPSFEREFVTVLFDHVGSGRSDSSKYNAHRYANLAGYAQDVVELGSELGFEDAVFVGHSCGAMIGALASIESPGMFESLILVCPSPRYINDRDYVGGFGRDQVEELLRTMRKDYSAWAVSMAPVFMGNPDRPALAQELLASFQQTNPAIAADFGHAIFTSDLRANLAHVNVPTLVLQCSEDPVVPMSVGRHILAQLADGQLETLTVQGHFPHLASPEKVVASIRRFVSVQRISDGKRSRAPSSGPPNWPAAHTPIFAAEPSTDRGEHFSAPDYRATLEGLLLQRAGEFVSQCGRYDMYALAIEVWLSSDAEARRPEAAFTLSTRGQGIIDLMKRRSIPTMIIANFASTNKELLEVISRHEIAARNYAVIPSLFSGEDKDDPRAQKNPREWYDYAGASDEELEFFIDAMERDIFKIASLYLRITDWSLLLKRPPAA